MRREKMNEMIFHALNQEENDQIVTLVLRKERKCEAVLIQFDDGTKYKIHIEETDEEF